ncbi:MAG: ArsR/SmtB family transcription factor [Verrucomicrobiota bacterium]
MSLREYELVMKAAADPTRVRILKLLEAGEMCVCQIVAVLGLTQSTISKHLFLLKMAGFVRERQEKKWVYYSLDGSGAARCAKTVLKNVRSWLNEDPVVGRDRKREALAREMGPAEICERGMMLPKTRLTACCAPPRKNASATK